MKNVCVVEDSTELQTLIRLHLGEWFLFSSASNIQEAKILLGQKKFDLILLDIMLPDGNGLEFCTHLKSNTKTKDIPLIFLTCKNDPIDKVMAFQLGAEDYVVKPFEAIELRARMEARIRKHEIATDVGMSEMRVGPLVFNRITQRVAVQTRSGEHDINLTPLEYKLLFCVALHQGKIFNRVELMQSIQMPGIHVNQETIYTHISAIRRKLGPQARLLECLPRVGYRFSPAQALT